jgi:hypothetical protein
MSLNQARNIIFGIFLFFFLIQIASIVIVFIGDKIYSDEMINTLLKFLTIYSVHFAVIFGAVFGQRQFRNRRVPKNVFWFALILISLWNIFLAWRSVFFVFDQEDTISDLVKYITTVGQASAFLIAGALTYFFTKGEQEDLERGERRTIRS